MIKPRLLAALPEADRELLTLSAWHGLSPREAASVVGCSPASYFVHLYRARRRLEKAMADRPESEHRHEIAVQEERQPRWT